MIDYGDGNGNQYIIEQDCIEYNPVKPKFSSSGIYDGGDYVRKKNYSTAIQQMHQFLKMP